MHARESVYAACCPAGLLACASDWAGLLGLAQPIRAELDPTPKK
jgi:hypothetical protein